MDSWEYVIVSSTWAGVRSRGSVLAEYQSIPDAFMHLGADGWELVVAQQFPPDSDGCMENWYIFKRFVRKVTLLPGQPNLRVVGKTEGERGE